MTTISTPVEKQKFRITLKAQVGQTTSQPVRDQREKSGLFGSEASNKPTDSGSTPKSQITAPVVTPVTPASSLPYRKDEARSDDDNDSNSDPDRDLSQVEGTAPVNNAQDLGKLKNPNIRNIVQGFRHIRWNHNGSIQTGRIIRRNEKTVSVETFEGQSYRIGWGIIYDIQPKEETQGPSVNDKLRQSLASCRYAKFTHSKTGQVIQGEVIRHNDKTLSILPFGETNPKKYWRVSHDMVTPISKPTSVPTPEPAPLQICPQCKGETKITITMSTLGSAKPVSEVAGRLGTCLAYAAGCTSESKITCITCKGKGEIDEKTARIREFEQNMWCKCEHNDSTEVIFHDNGVTPWKWCVHKHHYHCGKCRKIQQIG